MRTTMLAVLSIALLAPPVVADVGPTVQKGPDAGSVPTTSQGTRAPAGDALSPERRPNAARPWPREHRRGVPCHGRQPVA